MRQIITVEDIATYRDVAANIPAKRYTPFINESQELNLRNLLGDELYDKVVDDISPLNYPLLDPLIIPCLCYWTYARFVKNNRVTVTSNGVVSKNVDGSVQSNDGAVAMLITDANEAAANYANRLIKYLNENSKDYPEWSKSCHYKNVIGSIKVTAVGDSESINDYVKKEVNKNSLFGSNGTSRIY
jgi:hypothetical protein